MTEDLLLLLLLLLGTGLMATGTGLIYAPAGLIAAGALLIVGVLGLGDEPVGPPMRSARKADAGR